MALRENIFEGALLMWHKAELHDTQGSGPLLRIQHTHKVGTTHVKAVRFSVFLCLYDVPSEIFQSVFYFPVNQMFSLSLKLKTYS